MESDRFLVMHQLVASMRPNLSIDLRSAVALHPSEEILEIGMAF